MGRIIAIANQKGGVAKTTTTANLGVALARAGKRVLLVDADAQGSLTESLGYSAPDELDGTLADVMMNIINDEEPRTTLIHHSEGVDLLPANIELSGLEVTLINVISRETILKTYLENMRDDYDYILIDCMPSLGMITINALVAADSIIIPVQAAYLPVKGLEQLIKTIHKVKRQLNRSLLIDGILLTMVDFRTVYAKEVADVINSLYGQQIGIFKTTIPHSVRAAECSAEGVSIFIHAPGSKVAAAYEEFAGEVLEVK